MLKFGCVIDTQYLNPKYICRRKKKCAALLKQQPELVRSRVFSVGDWCLRVYVHFENKY